jgi:hypothetical protein
MSDGVAKVEAAISELVAAFPAALTLDPMLVRPLKATVGRYFDHHLTAVGHPKRSQDCPARLTHQQMRMLGLEDAQNLHCLRIDDHDLITDLEVFIPTPCRLDVDHRLRKWRKVNRVWHSGAGR